MPGALACMLWMAAAAAAPAWSAPPGWTAVGPQTPPEAVVRAPRALVEAARSGRLRLAAIELEHPVAGVFSVISGMAKPAPGGARWEALVAAADSALEVLQRQGTGVRVTASEPLWLGGARALHLELEQETAAAPMRLALLFVPDGDEVVVLSLSAHRDAYARALPALGAVASQLYGPPSPPGALPVARAGGWAARLRVPAIAAGAAALLGLALLAGRALRARRRRRTDVPPPPRG